MKIWGMTIGELSMLLGVIGVLMGWIAFLLRKVYAAIKDDIVKPVRTSMESLERSIDGLSRNVESETKWIHDRHSEVVQKLNEHGGQLDEQEVEIARHEERLKTLYKDRERGYKI